jgi:hypothetical protein
MPARITLGITRRPLVPICFDMTSSQSRLMIASISQVRPGYELRESTVNRTEVQ